MLDVCYATKLTYVYTERERERKRERERDRGAHTYLLTYFITF